MSRPVLAAVAQQQEIIEGLRRTVASQNLVIDYIARMAGLTQQVTAIRRTADVANPGQPWPDPPSQPAVETTEQAVAPEAFDSPLSPGMTPGSVQQVPAETTTDPTQPGVALPTAPFNQMTEVTAPVAGTETQIPLEQTRTEVDVRVGDPMNLERAFPWTISPDAQGGAPATGEMAGGVKAASRTMASMRLARLRIEAGTESGDDLQVAAKIDGDSSLSTQAIEHEISTLAGVVKAAVARSQRPAGMVPRRASAQRSRPSVASAPSQGIVSEAVVTDADVEDIFID